MLQHEGIVIETWYVRVVRRYRESYGERRLRFAIPLSIATIFLAAVANGFSDIYATEKASNSVTDIILSNIPVFPVEDIFVYGALSLVGFIFVLCLLYPRRMPFTLYSLSLVFFVRAIFVSLTHLGPYPDHIVVDIQNKVMLAFFGGGDQFFSGHTTLPFMMALIYWNKKRLRYVFLAYSAILGAAVLLGHLHYTIDVLSAFFISYSVYQAAIWLFPKERELFLADEIAETARTSSAA